MKGQIEIIYKVSSGRYRNSPTSGRVVFSESMPRTIAVTAVDVIQSYSIDTKERSSESSV